MLLCTVRNCGQALTRVPEHAEPAGRRLVCPRGHSFDVARSGYINLLQPQDRRSKQPGDTVAAVAARSRLHDLGVTQPLLRGIADIIQATPDDVVLDAGCGGGFYLGSLAAETGCSAHGLDISIPAVDAAARRYPGASAITGAGQSGFTGAACPRRCEWVVANADRFVPYAGSSFSIVLSITARMNAPEFRRVLRSDGRLLVALPGAGDLIELRGSGRDRVERTVETFAPQFALVDRRNATTTADLDAGSVEDVLHSIYRPLSPRPAEAMRLTFSLDLLLFRPK